MNSDHTSSWPRRLLKGLLFTLEAIALYTVGLVMCFNAHTPRQLVAHKVQALLDEIHGVDIHIADIDFSLRSLPRAGLTFSDVSVTVTDMDVFTHGIDVPVPEWADTLLYAPRIEGDINLANIASGKIDVGTLKIISPTLNLVLCGGRNNLSLIKGSGSGSGFVKEVKIGKLDLPEGINLRCDDIGRNKTYNIGMRHLRIEDAAWSRNDGFSCPLSKIDYEFEGSTLQSIKTIYEIFVP